MQVQTGENTQQNAMAELVPRRGPPLKARRTPPTPGAESPYSPFTFHFPCQHRLRHQHPTITAIVTHFVAFLLFLTSQSLENHLKTWSKIDQEPSPRKH